MPTSTVPDDPVRELQRRSRLLKRLMDDTGRISRWPKRRWERQLVLDFVIEHFTPGEVMTEAEVGVALNRVHSFNDAALLRRWLVDLGMLERRRDGSAYWRPEAEA